MGSDRRYGPGSHMKETVVCRHREVVTIIDRGLIGICAYCGQRTQYSFDGGLSKVLARGRLKGRWTLVHPPSLKDGEQDE